MEGWGACVPPLGPTLKLQQGFFDVLWNMALEVDQSASLHFISGYPFMAATAALARLGAAVGNDNCVLLLAGINSAQAIFSDKEFGALALR